MTSKPSPSTSNVTRQSMRAPWCRRSWPQPGLVHGRVAVIYSSGGMYHAGSGAEALDLQKPAFQNWLAFIGLTDVTAITIAGTLFGPEVTAQARSGAEARAREIALSF